MKNQLRYLFISLSIIILSTPLGRLTLNLFYLNKNLNNEYEILLKNFIISYQIVGILIFIFSIVNFLTKKNNSI